MNACAPQTDFLDREQFGHDEVLTIPMPVTATPRRAECTQISPERQANGRQSKPSPRKNAMPKNGTGMPKIDDCALVRTARQSVSPVLQDPWARSPVRRSSVEMLIGIVRGRYRQSAGIDHAVRDCPSRTDRRWHPPRDLLSPTGAGPAEPAGEAPIGRGLYQWSRESAERRCGGSSLLDPRETPPSRARVGGPGPIAEYRRRHH
jgi:hypothetical protein